MRQRYVCRSPMPSRCSSRGAGLPSGAARNDEAERPAMASRRHVGPVLMPHASRPPQSDVWLATPEAGPRVRPVEARRRGPSRVGRPAHGATAAGLGLEPRPAGRRGGCRAIRPSSLSHSHGFAALARAPGHIAVGVDVEWAGAARLPEPRPYGLLDGRGRGTRGAGGPVAPARKILRNLGR